MKQYSSQDADQATIKHKSTDISFAFHLLNDDHRKFAKDFENLDNFEVIYNIPLKLRKKPDAN